ncbi:MAG: hypothetical protein GF364_11130 [Candidatus Lokiarchaeota archaeon]|nr:hypothetical protein [Candidatus Lokiarchaeota archaeon]
MPFKKELTRISIIEVVDTLRIKAKLYILFIIEDFRYPLLFSCEINNVTNGKRSLFYGSNLRTKFLELKSKGVDCIECSLGTEITGGVSLDAGDIVEFGLPIKTANTILLALKRYLIEEEEFDLSQDIHLFIKK